MNGLPLDAVAPPGSTPYFVLLAVVLFGRAMDVFSTWVATPTLELEANPIARWLGWRAGIWVNVLVCVGLAVLPLAAISVATTSVFVAARNLQSAWLMRVLGEYEYRRWLAERYREARPGVFVICLVLHAGLTALVGLALMAFSGWRLVPFAVGFGIVTYAVAVALFTGLAMRRAARQERASGFTVTARPGS